MADPMMVSTLISSLLALLQMAVLLGLAGVALWRLGRSGAGLLLTATFAAWALKALVTAVVVPVTLRLPLDPGPILLAHMVFVILASVLLYLGLGVGLLLVPGALRERAG